MNWKLVIGVTVASISLCKASPRAEQVQVQELVDRAWGVPAEFGADVILTLIEHGFVPDRKLQISLLDQVFSLALSAQEPIALQRVDVPGAVTSLLNDVFKRGLDRVSLQVRAARLMLRIDPNRGRDLFGQISLPLTRQFACAEPMYLDLSAYYGGMSEVTNSLSDRKALESFLEVQVAHLQSAAQIPPFTRIVLAAKRGHNDFANILNGIAARLTKLDHDDRVFSSQAQYVLTSMVDLVGASGSNSDYVVQECRAWVIQEMNAGVCAMRGYKTQKGDRTVVHVDSVTPADFFNQHLALLSKTAVPIEANEISKAQTGPKTNSEGYSADYSHFHRMHALFEEDSEAQQSIRWQNEFETYIRTLTEWKSDGFDEDKLPQYYVEKALLFEDALLTQKQRVVRNHLTQEQLLATYKKPSSTDIFSLDGLVHTTVEFFDDSTGWAVNNTRHIVWIAPVRLLLGSASQSVELDEVLTSARQPALRLYGSLAKFLQERGQILY